MNYFVEIDNQIWDINIMNIYTTILLLIIKSNNIIDIRYIYLPNGHNKIINNISIFYNGNILLKYNNLSTPKFKIK